MHVDRILWRALRADAVDDGHGTDRVLMPVPRSSLIEKLAREDFRPVVSVVAPAGYGKTTLLSQWAERNGQAFAWVSVDDRDNAGPAGGRLAGQRSGLVRGR
jgi:hypothetical protein